MVRPLEQVFPALAKSAYRITSSKSRNYNCIAWAASDLERWWWPGTNLQIEYWPNGIPREQTLEAYQAVFAALGYSICEGESLEAGFEKIAIYADSQQIPQHAARQLTDGRWTSKLGQWEDIEHELKDLAGEVYGSVVCVMKRPLPG